MPISGTVTRVGAQPGALVEAGQALLEVADLSRPLVRVAWLVDAGDDAAANAGARCRQRRDRLAAPPAAGRA